jgi:mycothiol synthase
VDHAQLSEIEEITRASAEADGAEPLDEGAWRRLRHHADELDVRVESGAGFSVVDGDLLHLVVVPVRRGEGLGGRLLAEVLTDDGPRLAWSHGDHPAAAALARRTGFERVRELWVMRRSLAGIEEPPPDGRLAAPGPVVRPFGPGDEAELLRVNAAAFAHHPEQGSMDAVELAERMAEPWFDPADLIVAADGGPGSRMHGFHWTKRHSPTLGEVYVVAIDPDAQGRGLGRTLVDVGLRHLRSVGLDDVLLYVESDNTPAVRLYESLGFTHAVADTHVMYERRGRLSAPAS